MAQSIKNLSIGSKIIDANGNKFIIIARDHYASNEVTLLSETAPCKMYMSANTSNKDYSLTEVHYYLQNQYLDLLDKNLVNAISVTNLPYTDSVSSYQYADCFLNTKAFILSCKELGIGVTAFHSFPNEKNINYVKNNFSSLFTVKTWTRTEDNSNNNNWFFYTSNGNVVRGEPTSALEVRPAINLPADVLVSYGVSNGYYSFVFNTPPIIQNIANIKGNYGSPTNIAYTVTDSDDSTLVHYISFDNGATYTEIKPSRAGDNYTYTHVFNELKNYYCRIKVIDSANNSVVSNGFTIEVSSVAPVINIVSVVDRVVTFRTSCQTHNISTVEILINNVVVKTYTSGFDFNLIYEIDRAKLNVGKNAIRIRSTSTDNLSTYKDIEAVKTIYNLPPVGTKVIIGEHTYSITSATSNGSNQTYTLDKKLLSNVSKGQEIRITQDSVKVLCSMSNTESSKDYKEMKLVKTKKLKGIFDGYVEEKYELESEGRYSAIKIQTERFNNNIESEIIELQQYFDYMED